MNMHLTKLEREKGELREQLEKLQEENKALTERNENLDKIIEK